MMLRVLAFLTLAVAVQAKVPWPLPSQMSTGNTTLSVSPMAAFVCKNSATCNCEALGDAMALYNKILFAKGKATGAPYNANGIGAIDVCASSSDTVVLGPSTDQSYHLAVTSSAGAMINANNVYGVMYGMESFVQLITVDGSFSITNAPVKITDVPRFGYRSLLVDTSRHFLPASFIKHIIDGLAMNKLNVLHWHIVDSASFPVESKKYPLLAGKGAYNPKAVYTQQDMQDIVAYGTQRGVRVMVEFDIPGHGAWGKGMPQLMACPIVLDPTQDAVYEFLTDFLSEQISIFTDAYLMLGGDEVDTSCFAQNPRVAQWMKEHHMTGDQLQQYFWQQVRARVLPKLNKTIMVWENNQVQIDPSALPNGTIANVYQSISTAPKLYGKGMPVVLTIASSHWYLDSECGGYNQNAWECIWKVALPDDKLVLGGGASMWGEGITHDNFDAFVWRGGAGAAERLWSPAANTDIKAATARMNAHTCEMMLRGVKSGPNEPSFCLADLD